MRATAGPTRSSDRSRPGSAAGRVPLPGEGRSSRQVQAASESTASSYALIAPVGYRIAARGDRAPLFPTVTRSDRRFGRPFRVDRLHSGRVTGWLLDVTALGEQSEEDEVLVPDVLLNSAPIAEARTPYWLASDARKTRVRAGVVTRPGTVAVTVRR